MRDFNTVKEDLIRHLNLSCQKTDGEILWYDGTLELLGEFLLMLCGNVEDGEKLYMIVFSDGKACASYKPFEWHEVVSLPTHGRLIEESKVLDIVSAWCPDDDGSVSKVGDLREMLDEIEALPTIIPASEEGE